MSFNTSFPLSFDQPAAHPLENPMWIATGLRQTTVVPRHPQMMPTIGRPWHRITAAELRRDLVHVAKRPAALVVIEFD